MGRRRKDPHPLHVTVIRYEQPDGTRCTRDTPGAVKKVTQSETYYAWVTTAEGRTRIPLGTDNEAEAWAVLNRRLKELHDEALGIRDRFTEHAERPLSEQVDAWADNVATKGGTAKQVETMRSRVKRLAALAGWRILPDITAESALRSLRELQRQGSQRGRSNRTRNHYLSHLKQFTRWCDENGRLKHDPVRGLKPIETETDRRHHRRSPSDEEVAKLFAYLTSPEARVRKGMTGPQRALGYQVCLATGYRADELRSLTRDSFDLELGTVTVPAAYSKHRRNDTQPLPSWLVPELRDWFAAGGGCWSAFPDSHPGRLLKADLAAAGVPYEVPSQTGPLFFDFHALRHWYCTQAAATAPDLKTLLTMTRHSSADLALRTYAKPKVDRVREATDAMPRPGLPSPAKPPATAEDRPNPAE